MTNLLVWSAEKGERESKLVFCIDMHEYMRITDRNDVSSLNRSNRLNFDKCPWPQSQILKIVTSILEHDHKEPLVLTQVAVLKGAFRSIVDVNRPSAFFKLNSEEGASVSSLSSLQSCSVDGDVVSLLQHSVGVDLHTFKKK